MGKNKLGRRFKFDDEDLEKIKKLRTAGLTYKNLAIRFNVCVATIYNIINPEIYHKRQMKSYYKNREKRLKKMRDYWKSKKKQYAKP